jgi:hypothetical protein
MAGRRRQEDGPPTQLQRVSQYQRRKARMELELGTAASPRDRVAVATDFLRAAMASCNPSHDRTEPIVQKLISEADAIYRREGGIR